jgi:hypothetical protein
MHLRIKQLGRAEIGSWGNGELLEDCSERKIILLFAFLFQDMSRNSLENVD